VIEELVKTVLTQLKAISKTETVVGEPMEVGDMIIIPVSKITLGFAVGGGQKRIKEGTGEGTGGGATVEPVAFFVVRGDNVELITVKKEATGLGDVINLVPKIIEKVKKGREKRKTQTGGEGGGEDA